MLIPSADTVAQERLNVAIIAVIVATIGVFFGLPNLLRYLEDRRRTKRQNGVRDVLLKLGKATIADFMLNLRLSQAQIEKGLQELHRSGEITPHGDITGFRTIWMFKIHPHSSSSRWPSRF